MFYDWKFLEMVESWISIDDWYVFLYSVYVLFVQRPSTYVFPYQNPSEKATFHQNIPIVIILISLLQILCYSYSELPYDIEIYFWFSQTKTTSIRGVEDDGWASDVLDDLLFLRASR